MCQNAYCSFCFLLAFKKNPIALWSGLRLAASDVVLSFSYFVQFIPKMYPGYILLKKKGEFDSFGIMSGSYAFPVKFGMNSIIEPSS